MINAVTIALDLATIDPALPVRLLNGPLEPGVSRQVPGGLMAFQSSILSTSAAEPSVYRFIVQLGSAQGATMLGTWLFTELRDAAVALWFNGFSVPVDHTSILKAVRQAA